VTDLTSLDGPVIPVTVTGYRLVIQGFIPKWGVFTFISINSIERVIYFDVMACFGWGEDGCSTMFTTCLQILPRLRIFSLSIRVDVGGVALRRPVSFPFPYIHSDIDSSSSTNHPLEDKALFSSETSCCVKYPIHSVTFWKTRLINFSAVEVAAFALTVWVQNLQLTKNYSLCVISGCRHFVNEICALLGF